MSWLVRGQTRAAPCQTKVIPVNSKPQLRPSVLLVKYKTADGRRRDKKRRTGGALRSEQKALRAQEQIPTAQPFWSQEESRQYVHFLQVTTVLLTSKW